MGKREYTRVYLETGRAHHLLDSMHSTSSFAAVLCGRLPGYWSGWWGTGNQKEYERAEELPLCGQCRAIRDR